MGRAGVLERLFELRSTRRVPDGRSVFFFEGFGVPFEGLAARAAGLADLWWLTVATRLSFLGAEAVGRFLVEAPAFALVVFFWFTAALPEERAFLARSRAPEGETPAETRAFRPAFVRRPLFLGAASFFLADIDVTTYPYLQRSDTWMSEGQLACRSGADVP